ncbi:MAG: hypothetical protein NVSMB44_34140 [Ktedonobacteraceae bacterium]
MRTLIRFSPQAFVDLVLPGAQYVKQQPEKLRNWQLEVDALLDAVMCGEEILVHIEFQTYNDSMMAERLLRYNVLARSEYKKPVRSYVIYLLKDGSVQPSPLRWTAQGEQGQEEVLRFHYGSLEIGDLTPDFLIRMGQPALLPFIPLTRGGATQENVKRMFAEIELAHNTNLELIGFTFASMVFRHEKNTLSWDWLQERFKYMHDILRESPIYQMILEEGLQENLQRLRQIISDIVQIRFPELVDLASQHVAKISDSNLLQQLNIEMATARDAEQARRILLDRPDA